MVYFYASVASFAYNITGSLRHAHHCETYILFTWQEQMVARVWMTRRVVALMISLLTLLETQVRCHTACYTMDMELGPCMIWYHAWLCSETRVSYSSVKAKFCNFRITPYALNIFKHLLSVIHGKSLLHSEKKMVQGMLKCVCFLYHSR